MALTFEQRDYERGVLLELSGELDVASSPPLRDELNRLIAAGAKRIILDMSRVNYMDSSGLGALVTIHRALGSKGTLALVGCRSAVERVLRFTQFDKVLELYRSLDDLESGNRDNLRAVSGISKSVIQKQKAQPRATPAPPKEKHGRRLA